MSIIRSIITSLLISVWSLVTAQPLAVSVTGYDDACGNATGGAMALASGGTGPYSYSWDPVPPIGQGSETVSGLGVGIWTVTVTDSQGGETMGDITIEATAGLLVSGGPLPNANACNGNCNGTWFRSGFLGGAAPYSVVVSPSGPMGTATSNLISVTGLCPGTEYTITVTDANSCSADFSGFDVINSNAPSVLSQSITPSCDGSPTGTGQIIMNQSITGALVVQGTATLSPSGNILTISQLGAGELVLQISGNSMFCPLVLEIPVPTPTVPCASISGVVYADVDGGCIFGGPDVGMPHRVLILQPGDHYGLTDETGEYSIGIPYGSYTLDQGFEDFLPLCVDPFPAPFTVSQGASNAVLDLPESNMLGSDVSAFLNTNAHRPGEIALYTVIARNNSAEDLLNVTVGLEYDAILSFVSSTALSVTNDPGLIEWNVPVLAPFEAYTVQVQLQVPDDPELEGVFVEGRANVNLGIPDAVPENDSYQANAMIADNYEPQDKRSITSSRTSESIYFLNDDEYVDHTVRFQNTGVSTALFVFVVDTIKPLFDLSTLEILGASHSFKAVLNEGRELRFDMDNIMLPDSASDEPGSHGFVSFRLHPVVGVLPGDVLKNQAHVRFPSQQAFVTNETGLLVETSVGMNNTAPNRPEIYPNPVSDILFIRAAHNGSYMLDVFTVDGRWARSEQGGGSTMSMDVSDLAPGVYVLRFSNPDGSTSTVPFVKDQY